MKLSEKITLYNKIISKNSVDSQMEMVIEEAAELIVAIKHFMRGRVGAVAVVEELADMEIMLEQMNMIFPMDDIGKIKQEKLVRLAKRLETGINKIKLSEEESK